jgi:hypothetical protein
MPARKVAIRPVDPKKKESKKKKSYKDSITREQERKRSAKAAEKKKKQKPSRAASMSKAREKRYIGETQAMADLHNFMRKNKGKVY